MKVLGIKLHFPTRRGWFVVAAMTLVCSALALLASMSETFPVQPLRTTLAAAVGGGIAAMCGCSIPDYGLRAVILTVVFSASMMGLCLGIMRLIGMV